MVSIINHTSWVLNETNLKAEIKRMLTALSTDFKESVDEVRFAFVTKEEISEMHKTFLQDEEPTDILTFPDNSNNKIGGDIAICLDVVYENAMEDEEPMSMFTADVILHGLLHLFGVTHDYTNESLEQIYTMQNNILEQIQPQWSAFDVKKSV